MDFFHNSRSSSLVRFLVSEGFSFLLGVMTRLKMACRQEPESSLGEPSSEGTDLGLLPTFKNLGEKIKNFVISPSVR